MRKLTLVLFTLMLFSASITASAQDAIWAITCPTPNGAYSKGGVFPRYEYRNRRLVLVDIFTGQVTREVETSLSSHEVRYLGWSPDCRYLAEIVASPESSKTVIWDVTTSARIGELPGGGYVGVFWNPNSRYLVADTFAGAYLFDTATSTTLLLSPPVDRSVYTNRHPFDFVRWDNSRNQAIAAQVNGDVVAYAINTGAVAGYFHMGFHYGYTDFQLSPDNSMIAVFSGETGTFISLWNRDTLNKTEIKLPINQYAFVYSSEQLAISPDNRYVAVGALESLFIWDLQNLPAERFERLPRQYPYSLYPGSLNFVGSDMLEVVGENGQTQKWKVSTGEIVSS